MHLRSIIVVIPEGALNTSASGNVLHGISTPTPSHHIVGNGDVRHGRCAVVADTVGVHHFVADVGSASVARERGIFAYGAAKVRSQYFVTSSRQYLGGNIFHVMVNIVSCLTVVFAQCASTLSFHPFPRACIAVRTHA